MTRILIAANRIYVSALCLIIIRARCVTKHLSIRMSMSWKSITSSRRRTPSFLCRSRLSGWNASYLYFGVSSGFWAC